MNKKFLLTSLIALGFTGPAVAATTIDSFPDPEATAPGEVLPDRIYRNAAVFDNIHVYSGDVYAVAQYINDMYEIAAGKYLTSSSADSATICTSGYYCPGGSFEYAEGPIGRIDCSTLTGGYNSSDSGSITSAQCYKTCATTGKAGSMTGKDYYGYGMSTCEPASCVKGWTLKSGKTESTNLDSAVGNQKGFFSAHTIDNGSYVKNFDSVAYTEDSSANGEYVMDSAAFYDMDSKPGEWAVEYGYLHGAVRGMARLSEVAGTAASAAVDSAAPVNPSLKTTENLGAERGSYCYCNVTGYRPYNNIGEPEKDKWRLVTSLWAYAGANASSLGGCAATCAGTMAGTNSNQLVYRSALLGSITNVRVLSECVANSITVHWTGATPAQISATSAGSAVYGGNIKTPSGYDTSDVPPGQKFAGWKFLSPEQYQQQQ